MRRVIDISLIPIIKVMSNKVRVEVLLLVIRILVVVVVVVLLVGWITLDLPT